MTTTTVMARMTRRKERKKGPRDMTTSLGPYVSVFKFLFHFTTPNYVVLQIMITCNDNDNNDCDGLDDMEKKREKKAQEMSCLSHQENMKLLKCLKCS